MQDQCNYGASAAVVRFRPVFQHNFMDREPDRGSVHYFGSDVRLDPVERVREVQFTFGIGSNPEPGMKSEINHNKLNLPT
jgi:hypothetical protein